MVEHASEKENSKLAEKVADKIMNGTSAEAAESLSQALLPMNHDGYNEFLQSVKGMTVPGHGKNILELDQKNNLARIWSRSDLQSDYLIVTPGQNLTKICKFDLSQQDEKVTQKAVNSCIDTYAKVNKLEDPNLIIAGKTLVIPYL